MNEGPDGLCWVGLPLRDRRVGVVAGGQGRTARLPRSWLPEPRCAFSPVLTLTL